MARNLQISVYRNTLQQLALMYRYLLNKLKIVWEGSDSSSGEDSDDVDGAAKRRHSDSDDDDDDDDDIDLDFSDAPERPARESKKDYFERTKEYWLSKAQEYCDAEDMELSAKKLEKLAKKMCQEAF